MLDCSSFNINSGRFRALPPAAPAHLSICSATPSRYLWRFLFLTTLNSLTLRFSPFFGIAPLTPAGALRWRFTYRSALALDVSMAFGLLDFGKPCASSSHSLAVFVARFNSPTTSSLRADGHTFSLSVPFHGCLCCVCVVPPPRICGFSRTYPSALHFSPAHTVLHSLHRSMLTTHLRRSCHPRCAHAFARVYRTCTCTTSGTLSTFPAYHAALSFTFSSCTLLFHSRSRASHHSFCRCCLWFLQPLLLCSPSSPSSHLILCFPRLFWTTSSGWILDI